MKRTISTSIGNSLFYIEEDAYARLDAYLKSVRAHFSSYPDRDEIVADIESRISERFAEKSTKIITLEDVDALVATMGETKDFGDDALAEESDARSGEDQSGKRLYRDPDEAVLGGVAAGIAAYLGIDVTVVRLIFLISVLFGGTGVVVYLALWLAMPEASSATQKLQMRGERVTLESVKQVVEEKVDEVKARAKGGRFQRAGDGFARGVRSVGRFFSSGIFPAIGKMLGVLMAFASTAAFIALAIAFFSVLLSYPSPDIDFPVGEMMGGALYYSGLVAGFLLLVIPAIFVFLLALSLVRGKSAFSGRFAFPLLAVWLVSAVCFGVIAVRASALHAFYVRTDPSYQAAEKEFQVAPFTSISLRDGQRVRLVQATTTSVVGEGRQRDLERLEVSVDNGSLVVERRDDMRVCIFCWRDPVTFTVSVPDIDSVKLSNASRMETVGEFVGDSLTVELRNASRADLSVSLTESLGMTLENASSAKIEGTVPAFSFNLRNSSDIDSEGLAAKSVVADLENASHADISASETLDVDASNSSRLRYQGRPVLRERLSNGSRIEWFGMTSSTSTPESFINGAGAPQAPAAPEAPSS